MSTLRRFDSVSAAKTWTGRTESRSVDRDLLPRVFGEDTFGLHEMRSRLPDKVLKQLQNTIDHGEELDPGIADAVAAAMKDWALSRGATHYTHWFQPLTGSTAEKHDSFLKVGRGRPRHHGIRGRRTGPGRARRLVVPVGGPPRHVRGARLHGVGSDLASVHHGGRVGVVPLYPHRVLQLGR